MSENSGGGTGDFQVRCCACERPMIAKPAWVGREVECPYCHTPMRIPSPENSGTAIPGRPASLGGKRQFNFACGACDSLLEAHSGMSGSPARCPTCGAGFHVPYLDERGVPTPTQMIDYDPQNPTPMHAYAADGLQAPQIVRDGDNSYIICSQCNARNDVDAQHCASCGIPFTLEGAPTGRGATSSSMATASMVLGIISIFTFCTIVPGLLAVIFGFIAMSKLNGRAAPRQAIAGVILGFCSFAIFGLVFFVA